MIKRALITFGVAWLLGCVVTVLVTWWCALLTVTVSTSHASNTPWPASAPPDWPQAAQETLAFTALSAPRGSRQWLSTADRYQMFVSHSGWPFDAMASTVRAQRIEGSPATYELSLGRYSAGLGVPPYWTKPVTAFARGWMSPRLPLRPLPLGFIANTTIAAALFAFLVALFRVGTANSILRDRRRYWLLATRWGAITLVLGALTSIGVAIGAWTRWQMQPVPREFPSIDYVNARGQQVRLGLPIVRTPSDGAWPDQTPARWAQSPPNDWPKTPDRSLWLGRTFGVHASSVQNSGLAITGSPSTKLSSERQFVTHAGWPARCLEGVELVASPILTAVTRSPGTMSVEITLLRPATTPEHPGPVLPLKPLWLGLVANTLFYAYVIALPMLSIRAVRVVRRRRRGACESCGYSRAGLDASTACPECGALCAIGR